MARFIFKAKKGPDEVIKGDINALSEAVVINRLVEGGLYPVWIKEVSVSEKKTRKVRTKDLVNFTRQLSELLDSGLSLFDALNIIESQIDSVQLKGVIKGIRDRLKEGASFSESLTASPGIFSNLYINLVKSGEAGSALSEALANILDYLEKEEDVKSRIGIALAYPMLMLAVGGVSIFILLGYVIPRLSTMFVEMGEVLPLPTRMIIGLSDFVKTYWVLLILFAAGLGLFIKRTESNKVTKKNIDAFKLKLPVVAALVKNTELARFSRTLSVLLRSGVPILASLRITSNIADNEIMKEELALIYADVKTGSSLSTAIKKNSMFPQFVVNMITVGEEGGFLDKMLLKVAKTYEAEYERMTKILSSLLEPVIILIMGVLLGFVVVAMLLPVFQISLVAH